MFKQVNIVTILCVLILSSFSPLGYAQHTKSGKINLQEVLLPSDIGELGKSSGSIYYSKSVKDKALIPTNFWGEISRSGLHFIPQGTSLVQGLSLAGGPTSTAKLHSVAVTRKINNSQQIEKFVFDLEEGGDLTAHDFELRPGDIVFVEKSHFYENRAYYTSLIGVLATILSGVLLYDKVKSR